PGTIIAAGLLEHKPAATQPFETVRADIRKQLIDAEAPKRALAEGRSKLEKMRTGADAGVTWGKPLELTRAEPQGLSDPVLREVFRVDASAVPAYAGAEDEAGFHLIRVSRVAEPTEIKPDMRKAAAEQMARMIGQQQLADYVA